MSQLLETDPDIDAVFAVNDFAAIAAMGVLSTHGRRIPEDVAVIGYNDTPLAQALTTPLTTIASPMHQMGTQAFELLHQQLSGNLPRSIILQPELKVRATTVGK